MLHSAADQNINTQSNSRRQVLIQEGCSRSTDVSISSSTSAIAAAFVLLRIVALTLKFRAKFAADLVGVV